MFTSHQTFFSNAFCPRWPDASSFPRAVDKDCDFPHHRHRRFLAKEEAEDRLISNFVFVGDGNTTTRMDLCELGNLITDSIEIFNPLWHQHESHVNNTEEKVSQLPSLGVAGTENVERYMNEIPESDSVNTDQSATLTAKSLNDDWLEELLSEACEKNESSTKTPQSFNEMVDDIFKNLDPAQIDELYLESVKESGKSDVMGSDCESFDVIANEFFKNLDSVKTDEASEQNKVFKNNTKGIEETIVQKSAKSNSSDTDVNDEDDDVVLIESQPRKFSSGRKRSYSPFSAANSELTVPYIKIYKAYELTMQIIDCMERLDTCTRRNKNLPKSINWNLECAEKILHANKKVLTTTLFALGEEEFFTALQIIPTNQRCKQSKKSREIENQSKTTRKDVLRKLKRLFDLQANIQA